ncbi:MAG: type II secretion system minor pseudopilin GspJ [Perlucidibaca sp.]
MRDSGAQRGFTLVELLVAMAILAVLSIGAFQFLRNTSVSAQHLGQRQQDLLALERLQGVIANDLSQWVDRPIRDELGDSLPSFVLEPGGALEFTRRGFSNPLDRTRSDMLRVRYELRGDRLWRLTWTTLDRLPGMKPVAAPLGPKGMTLRWRVLARAGGKVGEVWPDISSGASGQSRTVLDRGAPEVVNLELKLPPWGNLRRVYWIPGHESTQ